jgi:uncharacterized protein
MDHRLSQQSYMRYPFQIGANGAAVSHRASHVREQIEQVLLTIPGERVFRRDFGAGIRRLVFEPNISAIHAIATSRLRASLEEALRGEVDPKSLVIDVGGAPGNEAAMLVVIRYVLGATGEQDEVVIGPAGLP